MVVISDCFGVNPEGVALLAKQSEIFGLLRGWLRGRFPLAGAGSQASAPADFVL
jgi:hypothetical protein